MVDVNNCCRKRRNSDGKLEVNNDEVSISEPSEVETSEPEVKMVKRELAIDEEESSLRRDVPVNNGDQNGIKIDDCLQDKLAALQEENSNLKRELDEANSKVCKCSVNANVGSSSEDDIPVITIKFRDQTIVDCYRSKFQNFLKSINEITFVNDELEIKVRRNEENIISPDNNRKRKRKKSKSKDLFMVDKTPSLVTKEYSDLKYISKYTVQTLDDEKQETKVGMSICFNCDKNHNLRDCPLPKDYGKISAARQKMKAQQVIKTRYHLEEERKYPHLNPGRISVQLKEALGVRSDELPPYIYRMRRFGYPPGWMMHAKIEHSNLSLYDMEGKEDSNGKVQSTDIDVEKIVEYPGFNMPMEPGTKDDYKTHDCPPFSEKCSKDAMINYIKETNEKSKDNNEPCDMDLDQSTNDSIVPPGCETEEPQRLSPSLVDLEQKKLELLAELDDGGSGIDSEEKKDVPQEIKPEAENSGEKEVEVEEVSVEATESPINGDVATPTSPVVDKVKLSMFGTPIIQSTSPYCELPQLDKFSKDISPVLNFENLPNSTGKYEQMSTVLQKVRETLKNINDKS